MVFETQRLILRPWQDEDAESLYQYAKDPAVGPSAGWPIHSDVENSRQIIKNVLSADDTYAVTLKTDGKAIGSIGLMRKDKSNLNIQENEIELGYWIGVPFWGQGMIPEAALTLMQYAFEQLQMDTIWCSYFEGNTKSKRVQEKCGFTFHHTNNDVFWPLINEYKTEQVNCITKKQWFRLLETTARN